MKVKRFSRRLVFYGLRVLAQWAARGGPRGLHQWGTRLGRLDFALRPKLCRDLSIQLQTLATRHPSNTELSDPRGILKTAYQINDRALLEVIALYSSSSCPARLLPQIAVDRTDTLAACQDQKAGVVLLGMHMGNGVALAAHLNRSYGPIHVVYRESNKVPANFFKQGIERLGLSAINANGPGGFREMLKALKRNDSVFILMDQGSKSAGPLVDFLGKRMHMPQGPAELARRTGAPIVPIFLSDANETWRFEVSDPLYLDAKESIDDQIDEISNLMAKRILAHPQWWSWHQRRWRKLPFQTVMTGVS